MQSARICRVEGKQTRHVLKFINKGWNLSWIIIFTASPIIVDLITFNHILSSKTLQQLSYLHLLAYHALFSSPQFELGVTIRVCVSENEHMTKWVRPFNYNPSFNYNPLISCWVPRGWINRQKGKKKRRPFFWYCLCYSKIEPSGM